MARRVYRPAAVLAALRCLQDQRFDFDWQPSTTTEAPLIQLARGEARNATTSPTSSARPKRPNGSSRLTNSAMPSGSACCRRCHEPPGNRIEPGATLTTRMLSTRQLLRERFGQAGFRRLDGVVGHAAARLATPDRRDEHDRRRRRGAACAARPAATRGSRATASGRTPPATPRRSSAADRRRARAPRC